MQQLTSPQAAAADIAEVLTARRATGDRFFVVMGGVMLLLTVVGFAPTFFLGPLFDAPQLPLRLHVHGALSTMWVSLFLVQAILIRSRNPRLHMRLGVLGVAVAAAMVASGLVVLVAVAREFTGPPEFAAALVWGNLIILVAFSVFVTLGLLARRRRPDAHKRLMLLATLSMMGQPLVRIGQIDLLVISEVRQLNDTIYGLGGLLVLLLVAIVHDLRVRGRPHPVLLFGGPAFFAGLVIAGLVISNSPLGQALIVWMR